MASRRSKSQKSKRRRKARPEGQVRSGGRPTPTPDVSFQLSRRDLSLHHTIAVIYQFAPNDSRSGLVNEADGSPGTYRVTFALSLPGAEVFHGNVSMADVMASGDSLLMLPADVAQVGVKLTGENEVVEVLAFPNDRHAMSKVQMRLSAQGFVDAARYAHDLIMPLLSRWSFDSDVAIDVAAYEVFEEATGSSHWTIGLLGRDKGMTPTPDIPSTPALRRLLSSYREGLSATNPFYRVLCFYKVIEGVKKQRDIRRVEKLAAGVKYRNPSEVIPPDDANFPISDPEEREVFAGHYGKKFTNVLDDMRGTFRNAVAHLDPTGDSLVADSFEDTRACQRAAPVLKYMAHEMLMHETETVAQEAVTTRGDEGGTTKPDG